MIFFPIDFFLFLQMILQMILLNSHWINYFFQIIFATLFALCNCDKLDNTYLPPPGASGSGGNFGLAPPNQSNGGNGNGFGGPQQGFAPQQPQESQQPPIAILSYENEPNYGDGSYKYSYETGMHNNFN